MTNTLPKYEPLHRAVIETPETLAALEVRTRAMILRARISFALQYKEPIPESCIDWTKDAIAFLEHSLRMAESGDPDIL